MMKFTYKKESEVISEVTVQMSTSIKDKIETIPLFYFLKQILPNIFEVIKESSE